MLALLGYVEEDAFVTDVLSGIFAGLFGGFIIMAIMNLFYWFGFKPVGTELVAADASGVRRGRIRYRRTLVLLSVLFCLFCALILIIAEPEDPGWSAMDFFGVILLTLFGFLFAWISLWVGLYSYAYDDTYVTALNYRLRGQTHRWSDAKEIAGGEFVVYLRFYSGEIWLPIWAEGRDELLTFADQKLNDAGTPRS